ncbi:MAG: hypothetical protein ACLU4N_14230 [Butyricimonas faecihominis]
MGFRPQEFQVKMTNRSLKEDVTKWMRWLYGIFTKAKRELPGAVTTITAKSQRVGNRNLVSSIRYYPSFNIGQY